MISYTNHLKNLKLCKQCFRWSESSQTIAKMFKKAILIIKINIFFRENLDQSVSMRISILRNPCIWIVKCQLRNMILLIWLMNDDWVTNNRRYSLAELLKRLHLCFLMFFRVVPTTTRIEAKIRQKKKVMKPKPFYLEAQDINNVFFF